MDDSSKPKQEIRPATACTLPVTADLPQIIRRAGPAAAYAFEEFFVGRVRKRYTHAAYLHEVRRFMAWAEGRCGSIEQVTPGMIGAYFDENPGAAPTRKLHLSAIRAFFDVLVYRHVCVLNPATSDRGEKHQIVEGKTSEISRDQARNC